MTSFVCDANTTTGWGDGSPASMYDTQSLGTIDELGSERKVWIQLTSTHLNGIFICLENRNWITRVQNDAYLIYFFSI